MAATTSEHIDAEAHIGSRRFLSEKKTLKFHFHDFANQSSEQGHKIISPSLRCHGYEWAIEVMLCPYEEDDDEEGDYFLIIMLCLDKQSTVDVPVQAIFSINTTIDGIRDTKTFGSPGDCYGYSLDRNKILDPSQGYLVNETLTIKVILQIYREKPEMWTPPPSLKTGNLHLLRSGENSDVTFKVASKTFQAHRCMLGLRAPVLASISENASNDGIIEVDDVDPDRFYSLLYYVYTCELPEEEDLKQNAQELLEFSDKYGCVGLKMMAEAELVSSGITVDTAADLFLFADSKSCPMLKEAVIDFFLNHGDDVIKSEGYSRLCESPKLLSELLKSTYQPRANGGDDVSSMTVSQLRKRLYEEGEDIDGTRDVLVKRFKGLK